MQQHLPNGTGLSGISEPNISKDQSVKKINNTVSHFSYAPLIKCKITQKKKCDIIILRLPT